jgi:hypothetical protein
MLVAEKVLMYSKCPATATPESQTLPGEFLKCRFRTQSAMDRQARILLLTLAHGHGHGRPIDQLVSQPLLERPIA